MYKHSEYVTAASTLVLLLLVNCTAFLSCTVYSIYRVAPKK